MDRIEAFESLVAKVTARGDTYAYFFDQLDSPELLAPLAERGFFKEPPGVESVGDGFIRLPIWPESRALARLADRAEGEVSRLILECHETDNPRVHEDFVDAALKMSAEGASLIASQVDRWLDDPYLQLLPIKTGELLHHLAVLGAVEEALSLARTVLRLTSRSDDAVADEESVEPDVFASTPKALARFDAWDYKTILEVYVPSLVNVARIRTLALLCEHLERANTIESAHLGGPPRDLSYVWRSSISEHEQNIDREPRDFLVSAIRDGATSLISQDLASLAEVVDLLEGRAWDVFSRLALYFAAEYVELDSAPGIRLLMRRDLFESVDVSREYELLLTVAFPKADPTDQQSWLGWLDEGPDLASYTERVKSGRGGEPPSAEELTELADGWQWQRLAFVPDEALPPEWKARKAELVERLGVPSSFPFLVTTSVGHASPLTSAEAAALSASELADYADSLPTTGEDRFSSPQEGFAAVLQEMAADDPGKMSNGLREFIGRRPVFVRSLLQGFIEPARASSMDINWDAVLDVAAWVTDQPREIEGGSGGSYADLDPGWVWTRSAIADLLEVALRPGSLTRDLAPRVWSILKKLLDDPDGGPQSGLDPGTASLNCIRGKSMHATVLFANWLFEADRAEDPTTDRSFEVFAPEVPPVLLAHLNPLVDPSPAVRAVFGMRLQLLMKLDPEWTIGQSHLIFSEADDGGFDMLGVAAWTSYLRYGGRNIELMGALRPQFVTALASLRAEARAVDESQRSLADRIITLYWWGKLGNVPSDADLLSGLFAQGSPKLRQRALEFAGRSLREAKSTVPPEVRIRLERLWEYRFEAIRTKAPFSDPTELQAFGWWMASGALDEKWSVEQLLDVLRLARKVDVDYLVVKALANVSDANRETALHCLLLITETDTDGWGVYGWKDDAYRLIETGLAGDEPSKQLAVDVANLLIARGFHEFRGLMPEPTAG